MFMFIKININPKKQTNTNMEQTEEGQPKREWTKDATSYLLDLWKDNIDGLRGVRKNTHIYKEMAQQLEIPGLSGAEVKNKIENLTKKYRKEQTKVGPSGGTPSTWEYYARVHEVLATSKVVNYKRVMVESTDLSQAFKSGSSSDVENTFDSCAPSTSQAKRRRNDRLLEIEERKLEIMSSMADDMKDFHEKLLDIFSKQ